MKKIMVVDDDHDLLVLLKRHLEMVKDFTVITTLDSNDGVDLAMLEKPDLIIMDIMMPNKSGGDVVKELRQHDSTKLIPVIFLTGILNDPDKGDPIQQVNVNGEFYPSIAKPFDIQDLLRLIGAQLSSV